MKEPGLPDAANRIFHQPLFREELDVIKLSHVHKSFGSNEVLKDVNLVFMKVKSWSSSGLQDQASPRPSAV